MRTENKLKKIDRMMMRFFTAQTLSLFGSSLVQYAIIWHITLSESSGKLLMIATVCGFFPQILISLFAGVWVDRYNRKTMIMVADATIASATLLLALAFLFGYDTLWLLFGVLMIRSAGTGIQTPAVQAILPQIVEKEELIRANGMYSSMTSFVMFLSPALSGVILSVTTLEIALFIDVITAVIGVLITSTVIIKHKIKKNAAGTSSVSEIKAGFVYLRKNPWIKRLLLFQVLVMFLISPSAFLTPLMVSRTFGADVWRLTASEMTYSLGMVLGGILIASWGGFQKKLQTTLVAGIAYGSFMIGLGVAPVFLLYLMCNTLIGITSPCYNAPITTTIQEKAEAGMHGRIFSLMQVTTSAVLPAGMILFGPLADYIAVQYVLVLAGMLVVAFSVLTWKKRWLEIV